MSRDISIVFHHRPGRRMRPAARRALVDELRAVGRACFPALPDYQCFRGDAALDDKVITVARDRSGRMLGFCSAILLDVPRVPAVLHLGLTCVHPDARGRRLTHRLTGRLAMQYLFTRRPHGRVWITNVACVLSSIGNVALGFDDVYPSPFVARPTETHRRIARAIDARYRDAIHIAPDAPLDPERFVFRGSVQGTVFHKRADDRRYHHRADTLNAWYRDLLDIDAGDEVVQVGHYSLATLRRYVRSGFGRRRPLVPPTVAAREAA